MVTWVLACALDDIGDDDVIPFTVGGRDFAVYRTADGDVFASEGHCTHERTLLCDGLVMDGTIECPKHNGRFSLRDGMALGAPVLVDLKMYPAKVESGSIFIDVDG
ncbi:MAG: Rieske 2Fe-2S domain-containing protein [Acidimicrobiales bacterium]